ncbi:MAG: iron ABC transporter permease [Hyphomonadaceae bacterium]|nr:iron ABC transporter permease [Hyphomonadaceae bacterium]
MTSVASDRGAASGRLFIGAGIVRLYVLVLAAGFLLLTPVVTLIVTSFNVAPFGEAFQLGTANWRAALTQPDMIVALLNTVSLGVARQALALALGAVLAWLLARTDLPGRRWLEVGFWVALFMPPLPAALAWVLLLGGSSGLVNSALYALPFVDAPVFKIYSWWGIIWVHMMGATLAVKVFLLTPAFRAMDGSLEEAARASGASLIRTFVQIVVPIMAPVLVVTSLIGLVHSMQAFEVELILGAPAGIDVYSTVIYRAMTQEPPLHGLGSALSVAFLLALAPLVVLQQWYTRRHAHGVLTGKARSRPQALGRYKWIAFAGVATLVCLMAVVPLCFLLMSTFMRLFGIFDMPDPWTLDNWIHALGRGDTLRSLGNTLQLGVMAALWAMIVFTGLAYVTVRSRSNAARALDFMTWLPALIPGVVLSLGLLQMFSSVALFRPLYGTAASLVVAVLLGTVTVGVQFLKTSMRQLGRELEEAGWACGGGRFTVLAKIVVPLIAPSIAVVGLETFAAANAAVGVVSLLGAGDNQPLSILQLNLLTSGQLESASVVGFVIMTLTVGSALAARRVADKARLEAAA